jgi:class 3 adenylate cyclase
MADEIAAAVELLHRGDCHGAFARLRELDDVEALPGRALEALARAAWLSGDLETSIAALERSFRAYTAEGQPARAGLAALMLTWDHYDRGARAVAERWFRRGEQLLEGDVDAPERGYLSWFLARRALAAGDTARAKSELREALATAETSGDVDLYALATWYGGFLEILGGNREHGLDLIDEAMAEASAGEVSTFFAGFMYCITATACRELQEYRRAGEWTANQRRWCERTKVAVFPSVCRINRASILGLAGRWDEAEQDARSACDDLERLGLPVALAEGLYELGELRLRRGALADAEDLLARAHALGWNAKAGFARLRLAQGRLDEARELLEHALAEAGDDALAEAPLLPLLAEVALAQGDLERARDASARLEATPAPIGASWHAAVTATTLGRVALAAGDGDRAVAQLRAAVEHWRADIDAPYEAAVAQRLLAEGHARSGERAAAAVAARAALATFERLGAGRDAELTARLLEGFDAGAPAISSERVFLFTDIVNSTALLEAIGDGAWHQVLVWHDGLMRAAIAEFEGEEVDTAGDGFFAAFPDAVNALACASAIQQRLAEHRRTAGFAPEVRIGVHADAALEHQGGYRGRGVHLAARIAQTAGAGEIVASAETAAQVTDASWSRRGAVTLKGVGKPVELVDVVWRR